VNSSTSGFLLAASVTVMFNTVLTCVKDAYAPLKDFMKSVAGHDWTTQGLADLVLFAGLGLIFTSTGMAQKMDPNRLIGTLIGAVMIAAAGLTLWFAWF